MLLGLLARVHTRVNRWLFTVGSDHQDSGGSRADEEYQSEVRGKLGLGIVEYLAEYSEAAHDFQAIGRATEFRIGWLGLALSTEAGEDAPFHGSWITVTLGRLGLMLDFGDKARVGLLVLD